MRYYVGVTDNKWFKYLAENQPDEVNFWQPGGRQTFKTIEPGAPFLFKLHSPFNFIVGGGFFVQHSFLPLSIAWQAFGEKNGAHDFTTFSQAVRNYRKRTGGVEPDPTIGCIVLAEPFFLEEKNWIPAPEDWKPSIVQGKTYDTTDRIGASLWAEVQQRLYQYKLGKLETRSNMIMEQEVARYGAEYPVRPRLGQGAFRVVVTEVYSRRCAITGERVLPVLQAAHIKPYAESGPHRINNGVLLRADLHMLLDSGYITLTEDLRVEVSRHVKEDYDNGKEYQAMHGKPLLVLPSQAVDRPSAEFVRWHNENRYRG